MVLNDDVLNTVMRFAGFFGVFGASEVWSLHIPSDDGSAVDIQGTRVLSNDGIHPFGGPSTTVEFTNPGLYALDVIFFEVPANRVGPGVSRRPERRHARSRRSAPGSTT